MWVIVLAALLGAPPSDEVGVRIAASAAAAQALQGPLDGTWVISARGGRTLYTLQFSDPVSGEPLQGAWRTLDGGRSGFLEEARRARGGLVLIFRDQGALIEVRLRPGRGGQLFGWVRRGDQRTAVTLRRN